MATLRAVLRVGLFCTLALSLSRPVATNATQSKGLKIVVIAGDDAVNILEQRTAVAPVVEVRDRNDAPVAGAMVRFAIRSGRAVIGSGRTLSVTTNAAGRATAVGFSPTGTGAVHVVASASFQGQTAAVTIAQTNVSTAAQAAAMASGATSSSAGGAAAAGGAPAAAGGTTGGAAGGAAAAGTAAGAGGAATGGLSGTAIGVIGGAAVGGAVVAATVVNGNSESEASSDAGTTYSGDAALQLVVTYSGACNVPVATITYAESGLLTMQVITQSDGSVAGTAKWSGSTQGTSAQCTLPNPGPNPFNRSWQISGAPTGLSFRGERTGTINQTVAPGVSITITQTDAYSFTGVLNAGVISGVLQHDEVQTSTGIFVGSGSATTPVTLR